MMLIALAALSLGVAQESDDYDPYDGFSSEYWYEFTSRYWDEVDGQLQRRFLCTYDTIEFFTSNPETTEPFLPVRIEVGDTFELVMFAEDKDIQRITISPYFDGRTETRQARACRNGAYGEFRCTFEFGMRSDINYYGEIGEHRFTIMDSRRLSLRLRLRPEDSERGWPRYIGPSRMETNLYSGYCVDKPRDQAETP